jgi:tetratricopeptide (TPR) repeat protein
MKMQELKEKNIPSLLKSLKDITDFRNFEPGLLLDIVEFLLHRGVYDEVGQMLTESNIHIPQEELPRFYYLLGMWYEQIRNMKKAVMYFDTVVKLYPLSEYYEAALRKRERIYRYYLHIR